MKILLKRLKPIFNFIIGLFCIWFVIWMFVPFVLRQTQTKVMELVQEKELDTGALFYTESPEAIEAGFLMMKDK